MPPEDCQLAAVNKENIRGLEQARSEDRAEDKRKFKAVFEKLDIIEKMLYGRPAWSVLITISLLTGTTGVLATALIMLLMSK